MQETMGPNILGISCFYHDSAATLVSGGKIVAAAQEERFSRKKHDPRFPIGAINYCLEEGRLEAADLDYVVFYDKPILSFERILKSYLHVAPNGLESWRKAMPAWLGYKLHMSDLIRQELKYKGELLFSEHHLAHAASAFYASPYQEAAILTVDGVGEWATATVGFGKGNELRLFKELHFPHSLGLLYSAFTYFCGFKVNSGEYKLMGLAPYGQPRYVETILTTLVDVKEDGSLRLNLDYFGFLDSLTMTNGRFADLFGGPPRKPETTITQREMDLAASIQAVTEKIMLRMARHAHKLTGARYLCLAGGVALNCVANGRILREGPFEDIWIQPAAGDAGGSLGAALLAYYHYLGNPRVVKDGKDFMQGAYLGPSFSNAEIEAFLNTYGYPFRRVSDEERARIVAKFLAEGKIVGYFSGRMEFGPRALGARSILADPRRDDTQRVLNLKIKFRESFRPFAPSVLLGKVSEYFELDRSSPYMLLVAPVRESRRLPARTDLADGEILPRLKQRRSDIPAVTHVDYSARVQTEDPETKPDYYRLIEEFEKLTGCPVIVNTSFNVRGEPIVCTPQDAYQCFMRTQMDVLVLENCVLLREEQPEWHEEIDWREVYELD